MAKTFSIVIPIYNEEEVLPHLASKLRVVFTSLIGNNITNIDLIFINDGSSDQSLSILKREKGIFEKDLNVSCSIFNFSRNFGHSAAVFAGLDKCRGDLVGIIDADLQDPPELLIEMIKLLDQEKADVVYGQRSHRHGESTFKKVTAWIFYRFLKILSGVDLPQDTGDFRIFTREVCDVLVKLHENEPFLRGLVAWIGFKQVPFFYERQPRHHGVTKYPLLKMIKFASNAIISFSIFPLRLAVYLGIFGLTVCILLSLYAFYSHYANVPVPGWASTIIGFGFGQSVTLLVIGFIGIYLGRIHSALQRRPRYILKKMED